MTVTAKEVRAFSSRCIVVNETQLVPAIREHPVIFIFNSD